METERLPARVAELEEALEKVQRDLRRAVDRIDKLEREAVVRRNELQALAYKMR